MEADHGPVKAVNSSTIRTAGETAVGMMGLSRDRDRDFAASAPLTLKNEGVIVTSGAYVAGMRLWTDRYGIANGTNAAGANITTHGQRAAGIEANSKAGRARIENFGTIVTKGEGAYGMYAVGTSRIDVVNDGSITTYGSGLAAMQALSKGSEASAPVSVDNSGTIVTKGDKSRGLELNSNAADGKANNSGNITLEGANSVGIMAAKDAGTISIISSGAINALGADSYGIMSAGSSTIKIETGGKVQGGSGNNPFSVQPLGQGRGHYFGGSAGILLLGGNIDIENWGKISSLNEIAITTYEGAMRVFDFDETTKTDIPVDLSVSAANVKINNVGEIKGAIRLGSGNDVLKNTGVLSGNVDLGTGVNEFINHYSGKFRSSTFVNVGAGNKLVNEGWISPGGFDVVQKTKITGNLEQTSTGQLHLDIQPGAVVKNDRLEVTGTAKLGGTVVPVLSGNLPTSRSEFLIVTAAGGVTDAGLSTVPNKALKRDPEAGGAFGWFVYDTVGFDFGIDFRGNTDVYLTAAPKDTASKITSDAIAKTGTTGTAAANVQALGTTLDKLESAGGSTSSTVLASLRSQPNSTEAAKLLERLVLQQHGQTNGSITSTATFGNAMLSCASRDGDFAYVREGKCYYAKVTVRQLNRSATSSIAGITETGSDAMAGVQFDIGGSRRLGLAIGYEDLNASTFTALQKVGSSEGHRTQAGIVLKDQWGPLSAYFNLTGSYGQFDTTRSVAAAGFDFARSNQDVVAGAARLRLSYLIDKGHWYFKPMIDLGATYVHRRGYVERDAGAFNLAVGNSESWIFGIMPGFEAGGQIRSVDNTIWRPYVRTGVMFFNNQSDTVTAAFTTAPSGVPGFSAVNTTDPYYAELEAGLHIMPKSGINVRLNYEGRFGEMLRQHSGSVKVSVPY